MKPRRKTGADQQADDEGELSREWTTKMGGREADKLTNIVFFPSCIACQIFRRGDLYS